MKRGMMNTAPLWRSVAPERRDSMFRTIEYLALRGFHARTIARVVGGTIGQVYLACQKLQIKLRDYRDGKGEVARKVIRVAPPVVSFLRRKKA